MSQIKKDKTYRKIFDITESNTNTIILSLTFLSLILIQLIIAVNENQILPVTKWMSYVNLAPFTLIIVVLAYLFLFLKHGYFWKIFIVITFLSIAVSLSLNFGLFTPKYYVLYQFSCGLDNKNEPLINFELNNFGKGVSINHILINISNSNYSIDSNIKKTIR